MNFHYFQLQGGNEVWQPIPADRLETISHAMFATVLSVDSPIPDDATKEQLASVKYKGPFYADLDDADSPASTAVFAVEFIKKLEELGVDPEMLTISATGGKGFHILVPEECFLAKPPKSGMIFLPAIYRELAFHLAVDSLDLRVYTARKGRMFRQRNVIRPNDKFKVTIDYSELVSIAELSTTDTKAAEEMYQKLCSKPRMDDKAFTKEPKLAMGLLALFDQCKAKVTKGAGFKKKQKPIVLAEKLPSFDAMLQGKGLKPGIGFHPIAMQVAITAHVRGISREELLKMSRGLCEKHEGDGNRYNTPSKRLAELARMWEYTEDNPCYTFSPHAVTSLLNHSAPDLQGLEVTEEEVLEGINYDGEVDDVYDHAGLTLTNRGAFTMTENGPKRLLSIGFSNVTELISVNTNLLSVIEADVNVSGKMLGRKVIELDSFNSVNNFNKVTMPYGQSFSGNDAQARGMMMRLLEKARKAKNTMYVVAREGLDIVSLPFSEDERLREDFLIWSDQKEVTAEPRVRETGLQMKFVGFPEQRGQFATDLSQAPPLQSWLREDDNKELMKGVLESLFHCQKPAYLSKLIGWSVACHYRMLFHKVYNQFPLLHINGAAGQGKTVMAGLVANFHYYRQAPKMLTPTSTLFAVSYAASGSASVPLILDEFKPSEMKQDTYDRFKLMMRDAYNCRNTERGGGNRENSDYRAVHTTALSAPICFIAEAAESESALMERVVLLTLSKPPVIQAQVYHAKVSYAIEHKHILGILGSYMAAQIVQKYSLDQLRQEFGVIYAEARKVLMLQHGEEKTLSADDVKRKSSAKERTVYNYSVVKFGLIKLKNLLNGIYDTHFDSVIDEMLAGAFSSINDIQTQTVPEWLKVLNNLADMTKVESTEAYWCRKNADYAIIEYNGKPCLELYTRAFYVKYRMYCAASRMKPLFPNDAAFVHGLNSLSSLESQGLNQQLTAPGGSHIFSLDELRQAGFISPE